MVLDCNSKYVSIRMEEGREGSERWGNIRHEGVGGRNVGAGAGHNVGRS